MLSDPRQANGIVDQRRLPRFVGYTNYVNYVGVDTWAKIAFNNTDTNDQGAQRAGNEGIIRPIWTGWRSFVMRASSGFLLMPFANFWRLPTTRNSPVPAPIPSRDGS